MYVLHYLNKYKIHKILYEVLIYKLNTITYVYTFNVHKILDVIQLVH